MTFASRSQIFFLSFSKKNEKKNKRNVDSPPGEGVKDHDAQTPIVVSSSLGLIIALGGEVVVESTGCEFHQPVDSDSKTNRK